MTFRWDDELSPYGTAPQQVVLERLKVGITQAVSLSVAESARWQVEQDRVYDRMIHRLSASVLAERLPPASVSETVTVTWPEWAGWWDHLKATHQGRWWMAWWARRRPPQTVEKSQDVTVTVDLQRYISYPKAQISTPDLGAPVRVATWDTSVRYGAVE